MDAPKCLVIGIMLLIVLAGVEFQVCQRLDAVEIESALKSPNVQTAVGPGFVQAVGCKHDVIFSTLLHSTDGQDRNTHTCHSCGMQRRGNGPWVMPLRGLKSPNPEVTP